MDIKVKIYDIETFYEMFLVGFYDPSTGLWDWFEFSRRSNDLSALGKYLDNLKNEDYYLVGYNNVSFDSQVIEYFIRKHENWYDKTGTDISKRIWRFAGDVIDDTNHDLFPPYRESQLSIKQIDLLKIHHFDNKNRRTSLKWLEFMMDMPSIEETPIEFCIKDEMGKPIHRDLEDEDLDLIIQYCKNDIESTYQWYLYTIGEVENEQYKGKNKILDRLNLIKEMGLSPLIMNYSDVKIGDEINKIGYCKLTNRSVEDLYEIKKARKSTKAFTFGECIPSYVSFQTVEFRNFYESIKSVKVSLQKESQEFNFTYNGTTYTIAKGGIHSNEKNRIIVAGEDEILRDADVGSQYPNAIVKRRLYPSHLGPEWLVNYENMINTRFEYKAKKNDPAANSVQEMFKLALNGGGFGKTNERESWQYDPRVTFFCTIGNQFEILMLVEQLEINGIHVVSANTDGIVCLFKKNLEAKYNEICKWWEEKVGNTTMGKLEFTDFKALYQESVNTYIAIKTDGKAKVKGRLSHIGEFNKNNTKDISRIGRKAIVEYFKNGTPIEQTIRNSNNIFDFCYGLKTNKNFDYEITVPETFNFKKIGKVIRFIFTSTGEVLIKKKSAESDSTSKANFISVGNGLSVRIFNKAVQITPEVVDINYDYYIKNAQEVIDKIERKQKVDPNQLTLF